MSDREQKSLVVELKQINRKQLQPNPFTTYRDPDTGRWMVVKPLLR